MSTAILISGQMRTFARCYPTQRWHVYRHLDDPHFFISVQDNAEAATIDLLRADYGADRVHAQLLVDPDLTSEITPELSAAYHHAPYANAADAHQLLLQHWCQNEVWKQFVAFSHQHSALSFPTIVRIRPDLWFHSMSETSDYVLRPLARHALVPWWGRFGGVNDRFAVMGREAAFAYFTVYEQIRFLLAAGCPFHPETLVKAALERAGCNIFATLRAEFSTLRLDGRIRPPEITPADVAHLAAAYM